MTSRLQASSQYQQLKAGTDEKIIELKTQKVVLTLQERITIDIKPANDFIVETPEIINERAYLLADDMNLPLNWAEVVTKVAAMARPKNINQTAWQDIKEACNQLYLNDFELLKVIIRYDWLLSDIFGCHPKVPMFRFDVMGLVFLLHQGDYITELDEEIIRIKRKSGKINTFRRSLSPAGERILISEL